ncbi:polysaccharide biosynthesis C-terminal domain-containing protein [Actinopolymorpha cephalotaxi]|uniref:UDP-2-acetamido-2,6-beta-L-arabino-hexul-4-ose reductase n=1 Tax=Actinopolymorpha cephalotaxi TaxID=504797 RepID=A0ABX2S5Q9_9ACTN|nr:NAD-dependent epimerase/dehydratase family protein [Actinopolymorpha cephalotaxi]NYH84970.1 UDP-2-acetamido-2,6-beta-L-arabino-hexul-4-ose reductase [Actinopolymorpha cephalotaxi]
MTGADGFLGWHVRSRLRALTEHEVVPVNRSAMPGLAKVVRDADAVIHLAGINRSETEDLRDGNVELARAVGDAVIRAERPVRVVYANSIQAGNGTSYGDGKSAAADTLRKAASEAGAGIVDVRLPNLFGEHGRPHYNSFVATFCHEVASGRTPEVNDREVSLLHAQDAARVLVDACGPTDAAEELTPVGEPHRVSGVLATLREFHTLYSTGDIPPLANKFDVDLFNTYRAALFPDHYPIRFPKRADARGELVECVRAHGGAGQTFVSSTVPGITRGEHFHLGKVERFVVLRGEAEIALRRLFSDEVVRFRVSGDSPAAIDMPTMWVHNITNIGGGELVTLFWTNSVFDPNNPDTYAEPVAPGAEEKRG